MSWRDLRRKLSCLYIGLTANPLHLSWPRIQKEKQCCDLLTWLTQIFCLLSSVCLLDCPLSLALPLHCTCSPTYPLLATRSVSWTLLSSCFLCSNCQLGDLLHSIPTELRYSFNWPAVVIDIRLARPDCNFQSRLDWTKKFRSGLRFLGPDCKMVPIIWWDQTIYGLVLKSWDQTVKQTPLFNGTRPYTVQSQNPRLDQIFWDHGTVEP